jgi:Yip1 domain
MYTIDTSTIWHFIQSFFGLVGGALRLDPAAFKAVQTSAGTNLLTLTILILAGISLTLGQSVVLLSNKVTPRRFVSSILLNGAIFVVSVLIWVAIFQLVGRLVFGVKVPFFQMARAVSLAYAPLLLSFFVLLPYLGSFLDHVLDVWSFLAMLVALSVTLHLDFWQALVCALLGWVLIQLLKYTIGRPIVTLQRWLRQAVAGTKLSDQVHELVEVPWENTADGSKGGR